MSRKTSFDELYDTLGPIVQRATGRRWWRKGGIQGQPTGPYATVLLVETEGLEQQVVETLELAAPAEAGETLEQVPWNTGRVDCRVEFYRSASNDSAKQAATRFRSALFLEARYWDLWQIAGMVGGVRLIDVSGAFRADIEPRAEVRFSFYANLADPPPLDEARVQEIDAQEVHVLHVSLDETETETVVAVEEDEEE